jgi:transcriptional regulator with XRE-family HTH domain
MGAFYARKDRADAYADGVHVSTNSGQALMHEDVAGEPSGLCSGPEALTSVGGIICALRSNLGWSQGRLAEELGKVSGHPSITREYVSRWEHGRKIPGPFWIGHLSAVFQVPRWVMEGHVRRRDMLRLTGAAALGAVAAAPAGSPDSRELFASIAAGDPQPLAQIQTSHATDLALGRLTSTDRPVMWRLARWADDGDSDILRVNAAGVLAKTGDLEVAGLPAVMLGRDPAVRARYLRAMVARVGHDTGLLAAEMLNPADSGARWCAAWLLARDGSAASRQALAQALRTEPVTENVRAFGLLLNGENPCS